MYKEDPIDKAFGRLRDYQGQVADDAWDKLVPQLPARRKIRWFWFLLPLLSLSPLLFGPEQIGSGFNEAGVFQANARELKVVYNMPVSDYNDVPVLRDTALLDSFFAAHPNLNPFSKAKKQTRALPQIESEKTIQDTIPLQNDPTMPLEGSLDAHQDTFSSLSANSTNATQVAGAAISFIPFPSPEKPTIDRTSGITRYYLWVPPAEQEIANTIHPSLFLSAAPTLSFGQFTPQTQDQILISDFENGKLSSLLGGQLTLGTRWHIWKGLSFLAGLQGQMFGQSFRLLEQKGTGAITTSGSNLVEAIQIQPVISDPAWVDYQLKIRQVSTVLGLGWEGKRQVLDAGLVLPFFQDASLKSGNELNAFGTQIRSAQLQLRYAYSLPLSAGFTFEIGPQVQYNIRSLSFEGAPVGIRPYTLGLGAGIRFK